MEVFSASNGQRLPAGKSNSTQPGTNVKHLLSIATTAVFLSACGGGGSDSPSGSTTLATQAAVTPTSVTNPKSVFVDTQSFSFKAAIKPATLTTAPVKTVSFYNLLLTGLGRSYSIATQDELNAFNQKVPSSQMLSLDSVGTYTYFLVSVPGCSEFLEYASGAYSGGSLQMTFNHFSVPGSTCLSAMVDSYYVFRAESV